MPTARGNRVRHRRRTPRQSGATTVRRAASEIAATVEPASAADQPGRPTIAPIASPRAITHAEIPTPQTAMTHALARTIVLRGVGLASKPRTVRSANSRPKTQAVRNANRIAPPTATACPSMSRKVGQSAVPAVSCALAPSRPSDRARSGSSRMTMNRPITRGAIEKPIATPQGTREWRALSISVPIAARSRVHDAAGPSPPVRRMKWSSSDSRTIASRVGGAPAADQERQRSRPVHPAREGRAARGCRARRADRGGEGSAQRPEGRPLPDRGHRLPPRVDDRDAGRAPRGRAPRPAARGARSRPGWPGDRPRRGCGST